MTNRCQVLLVSGSLRRGSTNTALLRTAERVAPPGVAAVLYKGMDTLPHFNPDHDAPPLHPAVANLRATIRASDAILYSTPEYAGALPGSFKNLLEWSIGDEQSGSIYEKPVAWVNVSTGTGAMDAYESLRTVLTYAHASIVEAACTSIPVTRQDVHDGLVDDPFIRSEIARTLSTLVVPVKTSR